MERFLYYLIMIRNGFGEPVSVGAEEELEAEKVKLEKLSVLSDQEAKEVPDWERVRYDIVPKWEWDIEHCPLMPVDLSEKSSSVDVIYLDHAATTPLDPEVLRAMFPLLTTAFGNPSSLHSLGQEARQALEEARLKIARLIGAQMEEVVFTSSGTESNNFAIKGIAFANEHRGNHIITSSIEHHSVLNTCNFLERRGFRISYLPVDQYGSIDPRDVAKSITAKTILISLMHANNEIGTIEPIEEIGKMANEKEIPFHTDAVQTVGHLPVNVEKLGVDLLSASAHKLHGPKGVGVLYVRKGTNILPLIHGGDQERMVRAGTENLPGIVGFGKSAEIADATREKAAGHLLLLREKLISGLFESIDDIYLNGHPTRRLPNNVNVSIGHVDGEAMLLDLRLEGICASNGSACRSSNSNPSHVLLATALSHELAYSALRLTLGRETTHKEIEQILQVLPRMVIRLRERFTGFVS